MMNKISLLFLVLFFMISCGNERNSLNQQKTEKKSVLTKKTDTENKPETRPLLEINEIKFKTPVNENNDLIVSVKVTEPNAQLNFIYRWFVNDNEIEGVNLNLLSRDYFKRGDWVFCKVRIESDKDKYPETKSRLVKIGGATPIIENVPPGEFTVPGVFRYTIKASVPQTIEKQLEPDYGNDSDEAENFQSKLLFELISPVGAGIILDKNSGEIRWNITKILLDKFGSSVEIKFRVTYQKGGSVNSSIILRLKAGEGDLSNTKSEALGQEVE